MDTPEGFNSWSNKCKEAFKKLKQEWSDREKYEVSIKNADAAALEYEKIKRKEPAANKELREIRKWLKGYGKARKAKKKELKHKRKMLRKELNRQIKRHQIRLKEAKEKLETQMLPLKAEINDLKEQKKIKEKRKKFLIKERRKDKQKIKKWKADLKAAKNKAKIARQKAKQTKTALKRLRPYQKIIKAYYALIRKCGAKDPIPGGKSVPVPIGGVKKKEEKESLWQHELWKYRLKQYNKERYGRLDSDKSTMYAGIGEDEFLDESLPAKERPLAVCDDPSSELVADKCTWHEGCIEFLWVEGTKPKASSHFYSNPITKTITLVMKDVNMIWGQCKCVRFNAFLKVITFKQLSKFASKSKGIYVKDGRIRSVSKDKIDVNIFPSIKKLQDHKNCTGLLVVDHIDVGAGFAKLGDGVGVVTINKVGHQQGYGDITAHELGHAIGITHVEKSGRKHMHGYLMWGKGCDGYPNRLTQRYNNVTTSDCKLMKEKLRDTGVSCIKNGKTL